MIATQKNWVNKTKTWPSTSNNEINLNKLVWKYKKHISLHSAHFILFCLMLNNFILSIKIAKTLRLLLQAIDSRIALQRRNSEYVTLFLSHRPPFPTQGKYLFYFYPKIDCRSDGLKYKHFTQVWQYDKESWEYVSWLITTQTGCIFHEILSKIFTWSM